MWHIQFGSYHFKDTMQMCYATCTLTRTRHVSQPWTRSGDVQLLPAAIPLFLPITPRATFSMVLRASLAIGGGGRMALT